MKYQKRLLTFLLASALIFGVSTLSKSLLTINTSDRIQDFITLSLSIFVEAFPFLVLGSLLAAAVNTFVNPAAFERLLPKKRLPKRFVISLLGFLFPVCECGNVPLSRAFMKQGFKPSDAITFLLAAPVINPVTIWSTWAAFSYDSSIVISRIAATLVIANFIGFVLSKIKNERQLLTDEFAAVCDVTTSSQARRPSKNNLYNIGELSEKFTKEAFTMIKMLAFGAIIAGVIQSFVPRDILTQIGSNVVLSIVVMMLLAFVVSICANVDAFFALSFANTFTAGSIVSFLVFGPMIDIKMLALLKTTFKTRALLYISLLAGMLSFLSGLVVTYAF